MEHSMTNASVRDSRFGVRPTSLIREWSFPLVLAVAWTLAATYTLVITSRQPSPVQTRTIVAPAAQPIPVVHAPASPQQTRRRS